MNSLQVILMVFVGVIGILIGMIVELIVDNHTIDELKEHNHRLKLENMQLRKEAKPSTIEILDRRSIEADELFKPW